MVLVVAIVCLGFQLWVPSTHVAEADYQAMANVLAAERQPGDVVLLAPWWTERARIHVPEGLPVVGFQGSDGEALRTPLGSRRRAVASSSASRTLCGRRLGMLIRA